MTALKVFFFGLFLSFPKSQSMTKYRLIPIFSLLTLSNNNFLHFSFSFSNDLRLVIATCIFFGKMFHNHPTPLPSPGVSPAAKLFHWSIFTPGKLLRFIFSIKRRSQADRNRFSAPVFAPPPPQGSFEKGGGVAGVVVRFPE